MLKRVHKVFLFHILYKREICGVYFVYTCKRAKILEVKRTRHHDPTKARRLVRRNKRRCDDAAVLHHSGGVFKVVKNPRDNRAFLMLTDV